MNRERPRTRALRLLRAKLAGAAATGQALATERQLAEDIGVSRTTLRWALAQMTEEGVLGPVVGRTRLVADPSARSTLASNAIYLFSNIANTDGRHSDGWAGHLHVGALQTLRGLGHSVLIPSGTIDEAMIATVVRERPIGVVLPESMYAGHSDSALLRAAQAMVAAGIPTVSFGEEDMPCDRVVSDHEGGAHALSTWLLQQGRRRQLCVWPGPLRDPWQRRRLAGHERALHEAGLPPPILEAVRWLDREEDFDDLVVTLAGHLVPHMLGPQPIDAVIALVDYHVPAICAALRRCNREPGRDVSVVGYDANWSDVPKHHPSPSPPAASIDKDNLGIGTAMALLLEDRIAGRLPPGPQVRQVTCRLVVSQTG